MLETNAVPTPDQTSPKGLKPYAGPGYPATSDGTNIAKAMPWPVWPSSRLLTATCLRIHALAFVVCLTRLLRGLQEEGVRGSW